MKIIALEEHTCFPKIGAATAETIKKSIPYYPDFTKPTQPGAPVPGALLNMGEGRIAEMDRTGITMEVLSYSDYAQWIEDKEQAVQLTREANDHMASLVSHHPDRFAGFATLPWVDPQAAADEMRRAAELGLKGTLLVGRPQQGAVYLDNPMYDPVWQALTECDLPIYIHPGFPETQVQQSYYTGFNKDVEAILPTYGFGWHLEPGMQVLRMILGGVFDRFPNLKVISGHWGEVMPFMISRFDQVLPPEITGLKEKISTYYKRNVWITPSGIYDYDNLDFCIRKFGIDHILFSADYPYIDQDDARAFLENAPLSQEDKEKIAYKNAEKLLRLA